MLSLTVKVPLVTPVRTALGYCVALGTTTTDQDQLYSPTSVAWKSMDDGAPSVVGDVRVGGCTVPDGSVIVATDVFFRTNGVSPLKPSTNKESVLPSSTSVGVA